MTENKVCQENKLKIQIKYRNKIQKVDIIKKTMKYKCMTN